MRWALALMAAGIAAGAGAFSFSAPDTAGVRHTQAEWRGKKAVVVAWFPAAFTRGCTIECKSLAEHGDLIKKYDATYFMASVDALDGEQGNKAFAQTHKADFPLLSDPTKDTARAYGVLADRGFANRWTFYIGKDGRIQAIDKDVALRLATSAEDMAAKLGSLQTPLRVAKK